MSGGPSSIAGGSSSSTGRGSSSAPSLCQGRLIASQIEAASERLMRTLPKSKVRVVRSLIVRKWWAAAAILILISGSLLWMNANKKSSIRSNYGQMQFQKLPDGTEVTLNANSTISFTSGWEEGREREVWIDGEAYFHVKKTANKTRFIVHTNKLDVVVTGTKFNVVNRSERTNVMLTEGKIILKTKDGKEITMQPGDFVEFNNYQLQKKAAKEEAILAWRDKKLIFENTSLNEVLMKIREHYDISIRLEDETIGDKTITGILPNDNLEILLQSLEATMDFKIIRNKDEIVIANP